MVSRNVRVRVHLHQGVAHRDDNLGSSSRSADSASLYHTYRCVLSHTSSASTHGARCPGMIQAVTNRQVGLKCVRFRIVRCFSANVFTLQCHNRAYCGLHAPRKAGGDDDVRLSEVVLDENYNSLLCTGSRYASSSVQSSPPSKFVV